MKDWFEEAVIVLSYSHRTFWALMLGIVGCVAVFVWGDYQVGSFELSEQMQPLESVIKENILSRYDKLAWFVLISFWVLAAQFYIKDRKKLFLL